MSHHRYTLIVLAGLFIASILCGAYALFLAFFPVKTIIINNFSYTQPIHVDTPVLHPGDVLRYQLDYCKFIDVVPTGKSMLVDGQQIPLTPGMRGTGLLRGCHTIEREVPLPETINPGRYYYNKELDYQVNPFRVERVYYYTEYFDVVGKDIPSTSEPAQKMSSAPAIPNPEEAISLLRGI